MEHFTPKAHCVLLGLKHDRRGVENRERDEIEISVETALQVVKDIGIIGLCCIESPLYSDNCCNVEYFNCCSCNVVLLRGIV